MLHKLFYKIIEKKAQNIIGKVVCRLLHHVRKVENHTILLLSSNTGSHSELYAIARAIINQKLPCKIYWAADNDSNSSILPKQIKTVSIGSYEFFRALAISRILIEDSFAFFSFHLPKKASQVLFQTWEHALYEIPQNHFGNNTSYSLPNRVKKANQIDYCIVGNLFEAEFFHSVLGDGIPALAYGHARNDQFFATDKRHIAKLRQKTNSNFKLSAKQHIFCYETSQNANLSEQESQMLKHALKEKFSGDWIIVSKQIDIFPTYAHVYLCDGSGHSLDYISTQYPCFLLIRNSGSATPELKFPAKTPIPVSSTISEVVEQIRRFDTGIYKKQISLFLREHGIVEDGHAGERLTEKIQELI